MQDNFDYSLEMYADMYARVKKIRSMCAWLEDNYPTHPRSVEGLHRYEKACDDFFALYNVFEHQFESIPDPIVSIHGTLITVYDCVKMSLQEALQRF